MTDTIPDQSHCHTPRSTNKVFLVCLTRLTPRSARGQCCGIPAAPMESRAPRSGLHLHITLLGARKRRGARPGAPSPGHCHIPCGCRHLRVPLGLHPSTCPTATPSVWGRIPCRCPEALRYTSTRDLHRQGFAEVFNRCAYEKPPS